MAAAAKDKETSSPASASDIPPALDERLEAIENMLRALTDSIFEKNEELKKKKNVRKKLLITPANATTAQRARVGRVAKQYGLTYKEWVELHGMRDTKLPRGHDPRKRTKKKTAKKKTAKKK